MKKTISINGNNITVYFKQYAIRIDNDEELRSLLRVQTKKATAKLIDAMQAEYFHTFSKHLRVSNASMAVEVWGHVYVDRMAKWLNRLSLFSLLKKVNDKVIFHCKMIDIGEKGHDNNRFVWDALSFSKPFLVLFLSK